jgi:iron complex outermembrane receptor protein
LPDDSGVWRPKNVRKVTTYGTEIRWKYEFELAEQIFNTQLNYAWTRSIDEATDQQMIYVPQHSADVSLNTEFDNWILGISSHYTGSVFARTDHDPDFVVDNYWLQNLFIRRKISSQPLIKAHIQLNNFTNVRYESVLNRPMPGIHFQTGLQLEL